jgi:hypothetical protein
MSSPSRRTSPPYRLALAAAALCVWAASTSAGAAPLVSASDCAIEQGEMRAWGWDQAEVARQMNEPNVVGAHRFGEFLEAFRAGLKVANREDDPVALVSYKLGVCAFETASSRARIAAQSTQSPPPGVSPKTAAPPPAMTNSANPGNGGFVAPPK